MVSKDRTKKDFEELLLEVRKVTRVTTGGRQMSFRAIIVVWDKKGKIGLGLAKWPDVSSAVSKASKEAYKNMFVVPITNANTVPYILEMKYKSSRVRLLPASSGTGLKAWSSVRSVLSLAGYENILSKILWSTNKLNNALATIKALSAYKYADHFSTQLDSVQERSEDSKVDEKKSEKKSTVKKIKEEEKELKTEKESTEKKIVEKKTIKKTAKKIEEKNEKKTSGGKAPKKDLWAKLAAKK